VIALTTIDGRADNGKVSIVGRNHSFWIFLASYGGEVQVRSISVPFRRELVKDGGLGFGALFR